MTAARWYNIDQFRILAKPLATNPAFTTHHIYLGADCVGRQLSAPSLDDCLSRLREFNEPPEPCSTVQPFTAPEQRHGTAGKIAWNAGHKKRGRGRPRKEDSERELQEALAS